ncbi:uncharacterized protein C4orf54 homolog [Rana temporaria]|uniref:uncharacterized protein C4orf54 homolog n=1 Tax=Rana temporaria TaxID=8407 RepID=UPI001AAD360D|nr:uncharacterized protein C4orf54 homolog [Rana temporaria]
MEDCTGGKTPGQLPIKGTRSEGTASYPSSHAPSPMLQGSANDEAHYITTHEIQLCEADQEPDYPDFGLAPTTWSEPLDSAPCTFLEYASFDSQGGSPTDEDCSYYLSTTSDPNPTDSLGTDSLGSTELVSSYSESDTSPAPRADESKAAGILLSIKTASKAIKEPSNVQQQQQQNTAPADAKHETDMTYCVSRATDSKSAFKQHHCLPYPALSDAHRLVAIPARLQARSGVHADISSGASSAVSELDDADKEVRNLTSRAFRSLAYPYFEAINFSSSESTTSLSDQNIGINSWSTYLDWKGSSFLSQKAEKTLHQHSSTTSSLKKIGKDASQVFLQSNKSQTKAYELVVSEVAEKRADPAGSSKRIQSGSRVVTLTETLNLVKASKPHELSLSTDGVTQALPREAAAQELTKHTSSAAEAMEGSNKSKYASSLIKNIISKKMQLEHEIKMERGEITDTSQKHALAKEAEGSKEKSLQSCKFSEAEGSKEKSLQRQSSKFSNTEGSKERSLQRQSSKFSDTEGSKEKSLQRQSSKFSEAEGSKEKFLQRQSSKFSEAEGSKEKFLQRQSSKFSEAEGSKEKFLQRQSSKFSEAGSDFTLVSSEDFSARDFAPADGNVPLEEASKSSADTMKGMFLRSQNSAFRSWKEKEIEKMEKKIEEKVAKARRIKIPLERDWRAEFGEISTVQSTKMSRLYVPGIQHIPKEKQAEKQATKYAVTTYAHQTCFSRNENEFKSEKLHILEATAASRMTPMITPKPQEIKLNLGLSSENKDNPFNIAKLLTPNLASTLSKAAEDLRSQVPSRAEVLEKMPQFLVRDIRESKPKTQGTIHQVRDVRKLLKNSYSHDNGDNSDRGSVMSDQSTTDQKTKGTPTSKISSSLSPIMITCQAVKNKEEGDNSQPDAEGGLSPAETVLVHRASGRLPVATIAPNKSGPRMPVVKIVSKASKWKQEKKEQQPEVKVPPQSPQSRAALEKLTAAVKTMEQLYVYDRKEWKRKGGQQPLTGSHVLSMIAGEEGSVARKVATFPEYTKAREEPRKVLAPPFSKAPEPLARRNSHPGLEKSPVKVENKAPPRTFQVSKFGETKKQDQPEKNSGGTGNVNVFKVSAAPVKNKEQNQEAAMNRKNTRPQPRPTSLKIPQLALEEPKKVEPSPPQLPSLVRKASADFENYLTIPVKSAEGKPSVDTSARDPPSGNSESTFTPGGTKDYNVNSGNTREPSSIIRDAAATVRDSTSLATLPPFSTKTQASSPKSPIKAPVDWRNKAKEGVQPTRAPSAGSEPQTPDSVPPATFYHHPFPPVAMAMPSPQGPIYYSPPLPSATPAEMYPQTQRKMLVDLATGQYYLVDTPVQPVKRRLFDPETGQYVDVPVPPPPVTPMPLHMPQLALSPGAYGPAYMFYPGFMPTPQTTVLPASTMQTPLSNPGSEHPFEMPGVEGSQQGEMGLLETPYYLATGSSSVPTGQTANIRRGSLGCPDGKQVINILSQPGPRIVAPPSFDGTTMRFVVEHR